MFIVNNKVVGDAIFNGFLSIQWVFPRIKNCVYGIKRLFSNSAAFNLVLNVGEWDIKLYSVYR